MSFSIYDILGSSSRVLNEAPEDETNTGAEENGQSAEDNSADDDFSIDASLDDDNENNKENDGDESKDFNSSDNNNGSPSMDGSGNNTGDETPDGEEKMDKEAVEDNTDIFYSLSNEEQKIKIKELKAEFRDLYTSIIDITDRLNSINTDESNLPVITRLSTSLFNVKEYVAEYLINVFPTRSFVENDIAFNRFLSLFNNISSILDQFVNKTISDDTK